MPCDSFVRTRGTVDSLRVPLGPTDSLRLTDAEWFTIDLWGRLDPSVDLAGLYMGSLAADHLRGWSFAVSSTGGLDQIRATVAGGFIVSVRRTAS